MYLESRHRIIRVAAYVGLFVLFTFFVVVGCTGQSSTTPPPPVEPTATLVPTPWPTSTPSPTATAVPTPFPTPESTATPTPSPTPEPTATSTPTPTPIPMSCSNGVVVIEPDLDVELVGECETLLSIKDVLDPRGELNWSTDIEIESWDGVEVSGWPRRITTLWLEFSRLRGRIPRELVDLERLAVLNLGEAGLTGEIPEELGDLDDLRELHLHGNQLRGELPENIATMFSLEVLDLRGNRLTGEIPSMLGNPANMWWLGLNGNRFSGEIPEHFASLRRLAVLNLADNRLTGQIPIGLGELIELVVLFLAGNEFTGCLPDRLLDVRYVDVMDIGLPLCKEVVRAVEVVASVPTVTPVPTVAIDGSTLAGDSEVLLSLRDDLAGVAVLNWSAELPIEQWDGVWRSGEGNGDRFGCAQVDGDAAGRVGPIERTSKAEFWSGAQDRRNWGRSRAKRCEAASAREPQSIDGGDPIGTREPNQPRGVGPQVQRSGRHDSLGDHATSFVERTVSGLQRPDW